MNVEELLREENWHLKNQITDLKNVFDINRDILRLLTQQNSPKDHEHRLLLQIITKLTAINNEALLANLQLSQEKALLKEEVTSPTLRTSGSTWSSTTFRRGSPGR